MENITVYNMTQNTVVIKTQGGATSQLTFGTTLPLILQMNKVIYASFDQGSTFPLNYTLKDLGVTNLYVFPDAISDSNTTFMLYIQNNSQNTYNIWVDNTAIGGEGSPATVPNIAPSENIQIYTHIGQTLRLSTTTFISAQFIVLINSQLTNLLDITDTGINISSNT
jgi:hypothetical protein